MAEKKGGRTDRGRPGPLDDKPKPKVVVVKKKKAPPLPVPSLEAAYTPPAPRPRPQPRTTPPTMMDRKRRHLPQQFEYLAPEDFALPEGRKRGQSGRDIERYNQRRERDRRDSAAERRAFEKSARADRRRQVREIDPNLRELLGKEKIRDFIETGEWGDRDWIDAVSDVTEGAREAVGSYITRARKSPSAPFRDIYNAADWWITKAPKKALGEHKDGQYVGGWAEAWDKMSTEEQIDTIVGGKSLSNVLQGQSLNPKDIASAIALAAMVPIPFGKGLPSLASALMRAGLSADKAYAAIKTGRGIKDALATLKTPVRPVARAKAAVAAARTPRAPKLVRPIAPDDAAAVASWGDDAARIGREVVSHAEAGRMPTMALVDEAGNLRAVAAVIEQGDSLIVSQMAGAGRGSGRAMMQQIAQEAADKNLSVKLTSESAESHAFYTKIGMKQEGKRGFTWTPDEAAAYAKAPLPEPVALDLASAPRLLAPGEAEDLEPTPGMWYHGTTSEAADEILSTGVLRVGDRREPAGAWLSASPRHAAYFGDAVIEVPEHYIPAQAERISAFGGMVNSPVDIPLGTAVPEGRLFDVEQVSPAPKKLTRAEKKALKEEQKRLNQERNMEVLDLVAEHLPPEVHATAREIADDILARGVKLPPEINSADDLTKAITRVYAMAHLGEQEGRFWYQEAARVVKELTAEFNQHPAITSGAVEPITLDQVAQLYAIFSQASDTVANIKFIKKAIKQYVEHGAVFAGRFGTAQGPEAEAVMKGIPWEGRKRSAFYMNIIEDVDPEAFEKLPDDLKKLVTVDRWVVRMFAPNMGKDVPDQYYDGMEQILQEMAESLGWKPKEIQAAAWVTIKGLDLPTTGPKALAGAGDAGQYGMRTTPALFEVPSENPAVLRERNEVKQAHSIDFEVTNGPGGLGSDLTLEQTVAVQRAMEKDIRRLVEDTPGVKLLGIEHDYGGWAGGVNGYVKAIVSGSAAAKRRLTTRFAKAFDQELVQASRTGKGPNAAAALVMTSPSFKNPQVKLAFFQRLNEIDPSLGGFMSGTNRGKPSIISRTAHEEIDIADYREAVERAAEDVGITVSLGKQDLQLLIGSQHGVASSLDESGSLGANYADDRLAGQIRGRLKKTIERARQGKLDTEPLEAPVTVQPRTPPTSAESQYNEFLDNIVRASGKGKTGVTRAQRAKAEADTLRYAERFPDDPYFDEFWRLREAARPSEAVDEIPSEWGGLNLGGFGREPVPTRTLQVGDKVQQLPAARSAVTRYFIERPADWTSRALMAEDNKAAALLRRVFPTASAEARVAKAAGRQQIIEANRAAAVMQNFIHRLPDANSPEDVAHFWWAQLPESERNVGGLSRIKEMQLSEIAYITSGDALESIVAQMDAVKAQLAETRDLSLLNELEDLRILASDLPHRLEDLNASVAQLTKIIRKPPELDPQIIEAVRGLSAERRRVLEEAGVLDPERATLREGLVSRELGLEETGEEIYIGHRLGKVRGAQPSLMPVSPGVGRARTPEGIGGPNKFVMARSGRVRPSTHVAAEDWQAAQTYHQALVARDDLAAMGQPFTGRLPEGYMLVNPKGRAIPRHWKTLPKLDEMDDDEIREIADEMMGGFLADADGVDDMIDAAQAVGVNWDELRIVPESTVKRYYGQFTPFRGGTAAGKAYDAAVDFTAASIVFARVGYIPKNIAQNLIMAVPHQGPFLLVNAPRAAEALADPDLRHFLHAEVGFSGATHGIGEELRYGQKLRGLPGNIANLVGKMADDPARFSAFLHEAAAAGVIPKYLPHLRPQDRAALLDLFTSEEMRPLLNDIRSRSVEAMADFSRLTPTQRRWARRFLIIPGWLWAGSRYPFHFAGTHPGRSALLAYVLAGEPYADRIGLPQNPPVSDLFSEDLPDFVEGIDIPDSIPLIGGKTFRTTSLSPVSTPYDIALALAGQSPDTAASYANPLAKSLWNIANQRVEYPGGSYKAGYQESIIRNLERLLPNWTFVKQEISPQAGGRYPEDETRLGRFFRELGVVPIKIVTDEKSDDDEWAKNLERLSGRPVPEDVLKLREVNRAYNAAYSAYEKENGIEGGGLTPQERAVVLIRTQAALKPERAAQAKALEAQAYAMTDEEAEDHIAAGREKMGLTRYDRIQRRMGEARLEERTHTGMVNGGQHG